MKRLPLLLLGLILVAFVVGLSHLFSMRFESGDIYPPYSSLRADPLGAKAFYQGLGRLLSTQRNYQPRLRDFDSRGTTLFLLGLENAEARFATEDLQDLETFTAAGGRVVVALLPRFQALETPWYLRPSTATSTNQSKTPSPAPKKKGLSRRIPVDESNEESDSIQTARMTERWKFKVETVPLRRDERDVFQAVPVSRQVDLAVPESMDWHSGIWFKEHDLAWHVIYAREKDRPVVLERRLGLGSLVLLSDSYGFSNEALRRGHPDFLAWVVGSSRRVIFDETHLGVSEEPGLATLALKHHFQGLFLALLGLAALFIWKNSAAFMPPLDESHPGQETGHILGEDAQTGFVNLIRRSVARTDLLVVCAAEWRKSCARLVSRPRLEAVEAIVAAEQALPARERNPVRAYRAASRALARQHGIATSPSPEP